jgi:UDP-N-acetylglucosamine:LPS N-acetylglucosamine transferase
MGGIAHRLPVERWPQQAGLRYLLPGAWNIRREDAIAIEETGFTFSELLASSDAVLTKPGYGTFTEAAVNGIPVLYVARRDWPEQPWLIAWLAQHGRCREVSAAELLRGEFGDALLELTRAGSSPAVLADGVRMAVDAIRGMLPIGPKEHTSLP